MTKCRCGAQLRTREAKDSGKCASCRESRVGVPRVLFPGDVLELPTEHGMKAGFVWDINGDEIEVRSYEVPAGKRPTIKRMTRAEACWYRIIPNDAYGTDRPVYRERASRRTHLNA